MPEYGFDNCLLPMRSVEQLCVGSKTLSTSPLLCNEIAHTQIADVQDLCAGAEIMYDNYDSLEFLIQATGLAYP